MSVVDAPRAPLAGSPERRPGSVRRTSHIDMVFRAGEEGTPLALAGAARDLRTGAGADGGATVLGEAEVDALVSPGFGADQRLVRLAAAPDRPALAALVGLPVRSGLRRALQQAVPDEDGTPLGLLLDELPVATLISGYATMRSAALAGQRSPVVPAVADRMSDMCSGWRADGIAIAAMRADGALPMQDCPEAPSLDGDDPVAWHRQPALPLGAMRRRRRIDVVGDGDSWRVDAMFRDTYGEPGGLEGVLHEYTLAASVAADLTVTAIGAEARVLPFPECPWATANVSRLVGQPVGGLRAAVPDLLAGIDGCTHLNDLLRSLADVAWLVRACV